MASLARVVLVIFIAIVAWRVCTTDTSQPEPSTTTNQPATTVAGTTAPTTTAVALTDREKQCAHDYHKTYSVPEQRMLWLKQTGREGIFDWAGGHWLSYDKIMEACDQRTVTVATTSVVTTRPATTTTQVSVTTVPSNPGDTVGCADFATWQEAQDWYDTYAPHYGDVASIDGNNNGVACEKLLPDGVSVSEVAATVTTAATAPTTPAATTTTRRVTTTTQPRRPYSDLSRSEPRNAHEDAFLVAVATYATGDFLPDLPLDVPLHYGRVTCLNLDDGRSIASEYRTLTDFFGHDGVVVLAGAVHFLCPHHEPALDRWIAQQ